MQLNPAPIDWTGYQAFLAIARAGTLARAAALEGVDATTMGRRLRRLEAQLGATLFERAREGQVLTEAGETLLAAVEQMARAAATIASGDGAQGPTGTVRLSVPEGFGSGFLSRHATGFIERHPGLVLDLVASSGLLNPSRREADVAVMLSRPTAGPLIARKLTDYALGLYATPAYLAAHGLPAAVGDLARGHRLIGYIPDLLHLPELRYLAELHPALSATVRSSSVTAQLRLTAAGAGIGVLHCFMADLEPDLVRVLPATRITRSLWLVSHADTHTLARVRVTREWLVELVQRERARLLPVAG